MRAILPLVQEGVMDQEAFGGRVADVALGRLETSGVAFTTLDVFALEQPTLPKLTRVPSEG